MVGNDLSPIQPLWVPPNCSFVVDDIERSRCTSRTKRSITSMGGNLGCAIKDWEKLYKNVKRNLKPGGWLELQVQKAWVKSGDDPELKLAPSTMRWQHVVNEAAAAFGKDMNIAGSLKQQMIDGGFVDVRDEVFKVFDVLPPSLL